MRVEYDRQADSVYLQLSDAPASESRSRTVDIDPWLVDGNLVNLDLDDAGRIVGVEICGASELLRPEMLADSELTPERPPFLSVRVPRRTDR